MIICTLLFSSVVLLTYVELGQMYNKVPNITAEANVLFKVMTAIFSQQLKKLISDT